MTPRSYTIRRSSCINLAANFFGEQVKLAGVQDLARRFDVNSNEALTFLEASTLLFIFSLAKNPFTKFMKMFIELTKA